MNFKLYRFLGCRDLELGVSLSKICMGGCMAVHESKRWACVCNHVRKGEWNEAKQYEWINMSRSKTKRVNSPFPTCLACRGIPTRWAIWPVSRVSVSRRSYFRCRSKCRPEETGREGDVPSEGENMRGNRHGDGWDHLRVMQSHKHA